MLVKRGEIYLANLGEYEGSEQGGNRPVLIIQNDTGNWHSPTTICAGITSQKKANLPTHVEIAAADTGLLLDSFILLEQIRTINKSRLFYKIGDAPDDVMQKVDEALKVSLGLEVM